MSLLSSFSQKAPNRVFLSIILGAVAGICYASLIPLVLSGIRAEEPRFSRLTDQIEVIWGIEVSNYQLAGIFLVTCFAILIMRSYQHHNLSDGLQSTRLAHKKLANLGIYHTFDLPLQIAWLHQGVSCKRHKS